MADFGFRDDSEFRGDVWFRVDSSFRVWGFGVRIQGEKKAKREAELLFHGVRVLGFKAQRCLKVQN